MEPAPGPGGRTLGREHPPVVTPLDNPAKLLQR